MSMTWMINMNIEQRINCAGSLLWQQYFEIGAVSSKIQQILAYYSVIIKFCCCLPTIMVIISENGRSKIKMDGII